jgi:16S rRNA processing protein RimM
VLPGTVYSRGEIAILYSTVQYSTVARWPRNFWRSLLLNFSFSTLFFQRDCGCCCCGGIHLQNETKNTMIYLIIVIYFLLAIETTTFSPTRQFQQTRCWSLKDAKRDLFASTKQETRKKKKNKYAEFSKTDKIEKDPFEALIHESEEKIKELETAEQNKKIKQIPVSPEASKPLEFPNNKDIDPHDPTTFGYIEIGTITGPHGVHGWTKVQGCTDFPERLTKPGMLLHMKPFRKRAPRKVTLAAGKMIGVDAFLIQLQGIYNRTEAQKLKGATLYYATQQDTVVQEDDLLISDLVGLEVYSIDDVLVGTVAGIVLAEEMCAIPGLGQDMLEVSIPKPKSSKTTGRPVPNDLVLIPLVPEIVTKIDLHEKKVIIDPPKGLLDLTYIREEKVVIKGLLAPAKD